VEGWNFCSTTWRRSLLFYSGRPFYLGVSGSRCLPAGHSCSTWNSVLEGYSAVLRSSYPGSFYYIPTFYWRVIPTRLPGIPFHYGDFTISVTCGRWADYRRLHLPAADTVTRFHRSVSHHTVWVPAFHHGTVPFYWVHLCHHRVTVHSTCHTIHHRLHFMPSNYRSHFPLPPLHRLPWYRSRYLGADRPRARTCHRFCYRCLPLAGYLPAACRACLPACSACCFLPRSAYTVSTCCSACLGASVTCRFTAWVGFTCLPVSGCSATVLRFWACVPPGFLCSPAWACLECLPAGGFWCVSTACRHLPACLEYHHLGDAFPPAPCVWVFCHLGTPVLGYLFYLPPAFCSGDTVLPSTAGAPAVLPFSAVTMPLPFSRYTIPLPFWVGGLPLPFCTAVGYRSALPFWVEARFSVLPFYGTCCRSACRSGYRCTACYRYLPATATACLRLPFVSTVLVHLHSTTCLQIPPPVFCSMPSTIHHFVPAAPATVVLEFWMIPRSWVEFLPFTATCSGYTILPGWVVYVELPCSGLECDGIWVMMRVPVIHYHRVLPFDLESTIPFRLPCRRWEVPYLVLYHTDAGVRYVRSATTFRYGRSTCHQITVGTVTTYHSLPFYHYDSTILDAFWSTVCSVGYLPPHLYRLEGYVYHPFYTACRFYRPFVHDCIYNLPLQMPPHRRYHRLPGTPFWAGYRSANLLFCWRWVPPACNHLPFTGVSTDFLVSTTTDYRSWYRYLPLPFPAFSLHRSTVHKWVGGDLPFCRCDLPFYDAGAACHLWVGSVPWVVISSTVDYVTDSGSGSGCTWVGTTWVFCCSGVTLPFLLLQVVQVTVPVSGLRAVRVPPGYHHRYIPFDFYHSMFTDSTTAFRLPLFIPPPTVPPGISCTDCRYHHHHHRLPIHRC